MAAARSKRTPPALPALPPSLARDGWAWVAHPSGSGEHALHNAAEGWTTQWFLKDLARAFEAARTLSGPLPGDEPAFTPGPDAGGFYRRPPGMAERLRVPPRELVDGRWQPRRAYGAEALAELVASVRAHGVLEDLLALVNEAGALELIAGHRRARAAAEAGLADVPVRVLEVTTQQAYEIALISNEDRDDLTELERGQAYETMIAELNLSEAQLAERVGRSRAYIQQRRLLARACPELQQACAVGAITFTLARGICLGSSDMHEVQRAALAEVADLSAGGTVSGEEAQAIAERIRDGSALDNLRLLIVDGEWEAADRAIANLPTRPLRAEWKHDRAMAYEARRCAAEGDPDGAHRAAERLTDVALRSVITYRHPAPLKKEPWELSDEELIAQRPGTPLSDQLIAQLAELGVSYIGPYVDWQEDGQVVHILEGRFTAGGDVTRIRKTGVLALLNALRHRQPPGPAVAPPTSNDAPALPDDLAGWSWEHSAEGWRLHSPADWPTFGRGEQTPPHADASEAIRVARGMAAMRAYGLASEHLPRELRLAIEARLPEGGTLNGPPSKWGRQWVITLPDGKKERVGPHGAYDFAGLEQLYSERIDLPLPQAAGLQCGVCGTPGHRALYGTRCDLCYHIEAARRAVAGEPGYRDAAWHLSTARAMLGAQPDHPRREDLLDEIAGIEAEIVTTAPPAEPARELTGFDESAARVIARRAADPLPGDAADRAALRARAEAARPSVLRDHILALLEGAERAPAEAARVADLARRAEMQGYRMDRMVDGVGFMHTSGRHVDAASLEEAEAIVAGWERESGLPPHAPPADDEPAATALTLADVRDLAARIRAFLAEHGRAQGGALGEAVNLLSVAQDALGATVGIRRAA